MRSAAILVLLLAFIAAAPAQQKKCNMCAVPSVAESEKPKTQVPASEDLKRLDADLDAARLRGDKAALEAALAEGMISVDAYGGVKERDKILARVSPASPKMKVSVSSADVRVALFGDTAIVTSKKTTRRSGVHDL